MNTTLKVVLTGATGMVGEGVLHVCLSRDDVEAVLVVGRKSCGIVHPKVREIIHQDFRDLSSIEGYLQGYDGCFFCLGSTPLGKTEAQYDQLTTGIATTFANAFARQNPRGTFCYVSAKGADPTGMSRWMWARVKGRAERELMQIPVGAMYCFRPGVLQPILNLKHAHWHYRRLNFLIPVVARLLPGWVCALEVLATAMIQSVKQGYRAPVLEVQDILELAGRSTG